MTIFHKKKKKEQHTCGQITWELSEVRRRNEREILMEKRLKQSLHVLQMNSWKHDGADEWRRGFRDTRKKELTLVSTLE